MPKIEGGYYLKARCIKESWVAHASPCVREVWDYLLREANHKETKYSGFTVKRGQLFRKYSQISEDLKWQVGYRFERYHESAMKRAMMLLRKGGMIELVIEPRGNLITVLNYDKFQNPKNYERTSEQTDDRTSSGPVANRHATAINKNVKNDKNEINGNTAPPSGDAEQGKEQVDPINQIMEAFQMKINPTINYGNRTQRGAVQALVKLMGQEKVLRTIEYLESVSGDQFAPTITTPYQLKEKLAQLINYQKKQTSNVGFIS
jgi:hypothetical protein